MTTLNTSSEAIDVLVSGNTSKLLSASEAIDVLVSGNTSAMRTASVAIDVLVTAPVISSSKYKLPPLVT